MGTTKADLAIFGTGAMACLFASRLTAAGVQLMMVGTWTEGINALHEAGILVVEVSGEERGYPVRVTTDPSDCAGVEHALVLVKSWQTERVARQLAACLSPIGLALTLQNGDGNYEVLARQLGEPRVALGTTTAGATLIGPGKVRPGGEGVVSLGIHARLQPLAAMLVQAGFIVETVPDIQSLQWGKLVINASINPLTALLRIPNGELLNREPARSLMASLAREAAAVAVARGIRLPYDDPVSAAEAVARRTSANFSSMFQDVLRGAPTEIDAICGAVVRAAEQKGIAVPVNHTLWLLVKSIARSGGVN